MVGLIFIFSASLCDSNLLARVTLLPNMQYLGIRVPTTPATIDPECKPIRIWKASENAYLKGKRKLITKLL